MLVMSTGYDRVAKVALYVLERVAGGLDMLYCNEVNVRTSPAGTHTKMVTSISPVAKNSTVCAFPVERVISSMSADSIYAASPVET